MKTTLDIDDHLLSQAKATAARERRSLTGFIEEGLVLRLRAKARKSGKGRVTLPVLKGSGGLAPGIDPTRNESLLDAADA